MEPEKLIAVYSPVFDFDAHGNAIGFPVDSDVTPALPGGILEGTYCRLEPLNASAHTSDLYSAFEGHDDLWTYMPQGPFQSEGEYRSWVESKEGGQDPYFYSIIDKSSGKALGVASYLRIDPTARSIEVGWITFSPKLKRTRIATEAMFIMMRNAFELGYRRYEWKCNALNAASRNAALRLGMTYEGTFRQATVVKGRNRDTAWFSIVDSEWPQMKAKFERWLDAGNFDGNGTQLTALLFCDGGQG